MYLLLSRSPTPAAEDWTDHLERILKSVLDIEHYLTTFERLTAASQWPSETWVLHLVSLLKGKARAAYVAMNIDDSKDYIKVKKAILDKFEINAETYSQCFRAKTIQEGEMVKELQARLNDMFKKRQKPKTIYVSRSY